MAGLIAVGILAYGSTDLGGSKTPACKDGS